jgi:uncharacterized YccA/Bax inhibitor family protein
MKIFNPILDKINTKLSDGSKASFRGISSKIYMLLFLVLVSGYLTFTYVSLENYFNVVIVFSLSSLLLIFIGFRRDSFPVALSLLYAICEGCVLGIVVKLAESVVPGIAISAASATLVVFFVVLVFYSQKIVVVTEKFRKNMIIIFFSIICFILINILLDFFGGYNLIFNQGDAILISMIVSFFMVIYSAFMLILHFDFAENVVNGGLSESHEWTVAVGIVISLIFLYFEILRLMLLNAIKK